MQSIGDSEKILDSFKYRPGQLDAINDIIKAFSSGVSNVILDAEVGAGKSKILVDALKAIGLRAYYTSPKVALISQLDSDSLVASDVRTVFGRANYPCTYLDDGVTSAAEAPCVSGEICKFCHGKRCECCDNKGLVTLKECPEDLKGNCPYYNHKRKALVGNIATMTADYFTLAVKYSEDSKDNVFKQRDVMVIDEAHNLGEYGIAQMGVNLSLNISNEYQWVEWWNDIGKKVMKLSEKQLDDVSNELIKDILGQASDRLKISIDALKSEPMEGYKAQTVAKRYKKIAILEMIKHKLDVAVADISYGSEWVIEKDVASFTATPINSRLFLMKNWWPLSKFRVFSSGTFIDPEFYMSEIGLDEDAVKVIKVPYMFPCERAPIISNMSVGVISRENRSESWPKALKRIRIILENNACRKYRGIIHCHSYDNLKSIKECFSNDELGKRMVFHDRDDRNDVLEEWLSAAPGGNEVLVSVNMNEGLDLKDDLARFQINVKCPWPSLGSRRVRKRLAMSDGRKWFEYQALRSEIQSWGRLFRSANDFGNTYLIDSATVNLVRKYINVLPEGARGRFEAGRNGKPFMPG